MTVFLKETKKEDLSNLISKTIAKTFINFFSQVIAKIVAALPRSMYGALYYRHIDKQHGLKHTKGNYEGFVKITKESLSELNWWKENLPNIYQKINHELPTVTLYSDASTLGWEAYIRDQNEFIYHINTKEMLAVKFALNNFLMYPSNYLLITPQ